MDKTSFDVKIFDWDYWSLTALTKETYFFCVGFNYLIDGWNDLSEAEYRKPNLKTIFVRLGTSHGLNIIIFVCIIFSYIFDDINS